MSALTVRRSEDPRDQLLHVRVGPLVGGRPHRLPEHPVRPARRAEDVVEEVDVLLDLGQPEGRERRDELAEGLPGELAGPTLGEHPAGQDELLPP